MTDEKYLFISDVREKKRTATGSHHKRTHCGKGGSIKFPCDFMSKKELQEMNGEVKSYRLNEPMSWQEFKAMPDDLRIAYVTALRKKYRVPDIRLAEMFGISPDNVSLMFKRLGLDAGKTRARKNWDYDSWIEWLNGVPIETQEDEQGEETCDAIHEESVVEEVEQGVSETVVPAVPTQGMMRFECSADAALKSIAQLLQNANVRLSLSWEIIPEKGGTDG